MKIKKFDEQFEKCPYPQYSKECRAYHTAQIKAKTYILSLITSMSDEMMGEDAGYTEDDYTYLDTRYNSNAVRYGINEKREEIKSIADKYLKKI